MRTVREATFDALRRLGMTTLFANPGSTEFPLLVGLPDDLGFVLALHEGSVVGLATGYALARERPALVLLHTTAGLGNAVGALATARVNRAPLVVLVGQRDRRHLALEPFLAGQLSGLAGSYPVWVDQPVRAADVPGAVVRACHEAVTGRGPALVAICMDDWPAPFAEEVAIGPYQLSRPVAVADSGIWPNSWRCSPSPVRRPWWSAREQTARPVEPRPRRWPRPCAAPSGRSHSVPGPNAPDQAVAQAPTTRRATPAMARRRPRSPRPGGR